MKKDAQAYVAYENEANSLGVLTIQHNNRLVSSI